MHVSTLCLNVELIAAESAACRYMATGGADASVTLWDLQDHLCYATLANVDQPVQSVSFSHDSELLAYTSDDAGIHLAEVATGEAAPITE